MSERKSIRLKSLQRQKRDFMIVCATFYVLDLHLLNLPITTSNWCRFDVLFRLGLILLIYWEVHMTVDVLEDVHKQNKKKSKFNDNCEYVSVFDESLLCFFFWIFGRNSLNQQYLLLFTTELARAVRSQRSLPTVFFRRVLKWID